MIRWTLSIDVGTTATAAAVGQDGERRLLELDGRSAMPSTVLAGPDGAIVVGGAAEAQAALTPDRVERTPKRRLGDPVILLGEQAVEPVDAIAAIIGHVAAAAAAQMGGATADRLVLTHPARWGSRRLALLTEAADRCGLPEPVLVAEPVAAAAHLARDLTDPGDLLAVYDLGGGTLDVAIVRRTEDGFVVAGPPGGDDALGGEALDERIVQALLDRLDVGVRADLERSDDRIWQQARLQFRREARGAKEALSTTSDYRWYAGSPVDEQLRLTSAELEALVREPIAATVQSTLAVIARAGLSPEALKTVVMVGGSARTPMVGRMLAAGVGRPPTTWGDPKAAVCLGALTVAEERRPAGPGPAPTPTVRAAPEPQPEPEPDPQPEPVSEPAATPGPPGAPTTPPPAPEGPDAESDAASDRAPDDGLDADPDPVPEPGADPTAVPAGSWTRERLGVAIAVGLISLGLVSALLATLVR